MARESIRAGEIGRRLRWRQLITDAPADYASASTTNLIVYNTTTGTSTTFAGTQSTDATYVYVDYTTAATTDLDEPGECQLQGHRITPTTNLRTPVSWFNVEPTL